MTIAVQPVTSMGEVGLESEEAAPGKRKTAKVWPTRWFPIGIEEFERAGEKGLAALAVYAALAGLRSRAPAEHRGRFFADYGQIAKLAAVSQRSLARPIRNLEELGLIKVIRATGKARLEHQANQYTLLPIIVSGNLLEPTSKRRSGSRSDASPEGKRTPTLDCPHNRGTPFQGVDSIPAGAGASADALAGGKESGDAKDRPDFFKGLR